MSPNEIDAIRKEIAKLRADLRKKRRRAPIVAKAQELRVGNAARRDAGLMQSAAGCTEGLV